MTCRPFAISAALLLAALPVLAAAQPTTEPTTQPTSRPTTQPTTMPAEMDEAEPVDEMVEQEVLQEDVATKTLTDRIMKAHGIDAWNRVDRIKFTFIPARDTAELAEVHHDWDRVAGEDTVRLGDLGEPVTVNVGAFDSESATEDEKRAFQRWTNDGFWLLAVFKLRDAGGTRSVLERTEINGVEYDALQVTYEGVGLTPGDSYVYYADEAGVVRYWDYRPAGTERSVRWSWEDYQNVGGVMLALDHKPQGSSGQAPRILIDNVEVEVRAD